MTQSLLFIDVMNYPWNQHTHSTYYNIIMKDIKSKINIYKKD